MHFSWVKRRQDCESILGGKINQTYDGIGLEDEEEALRWMVRVAQEALSMIAEAWMSDKAAGPMGVALAEVGNTGRGEVGRWRKENEFGLGYIFLYFLNTHGALLRKHLDIHI